MLPAFPDAGRLRRARGPRRETRVKAIILAALAAILVPSASAQTGAGPGADSGAAPLPRTSEGRPDFHGVWASRWLTPVERPAEATGLVVDAAEAARLARAILDRAAQPSQLDPELAYPDAETLAIVRGEHRSSLVIAPATGRLPFTDAGRAAARAYVGGADGPEQRMTTERCLGGVGWAPLQIRAASMLRRIVQTPAHVVIHSEAYSDLRLIPIDGAPLPSSIRPPTGDSIARWDGDALIVETRNFAPALSTHGIVTVLSPDASIVERFEMSGPDELVYRYTVTDPAYYAEPWTAEYAFTRSSDAIFEFACHEGNYSMAGMLAGARREESLASKTR